MLAWIMNLDFAAGTAPTVAVGLARTPWHRGFGTLGVR